MKDIVISHRGKSGDLPIHEFSLESMCPNPAMVMIAKRGSGKSVVVKSILKHFSKTVPVGIVISPTDKMNGFYKDFVPDIYIYYEFKTETIEDVLKRQKDIIKKEKDRQERYPNKKQINTKAYVVMDDCLSSKGTWSSDKNILELLFNGRHFHIMYILTMQFPLGIKPELRCNFDYIFLLADDTISNQKRIYDHYAGMFPNFDAFRQVFEQLTEDYGCMVICNRGVRKMFYDKIFYYKAKYDVSEKDELIGTKQYIEFNNNNFNKDWNAEEKPIDINVSMSRSKLRNSKIHVSKKQIS